MAVIREVAGRGEILDKARLHFDENVLPVLKGEFARYENNIELLMHSINSGKRLRPFYCIQSFRLAGGADEEAANYGAAAMELVHCGSLIIDDQLDKKEHRPDRNLDTVRMKFSTEESVFLGACLETLYSHHLLAKACKGLPREREEAVLETFVSTFSEGVTREINKWKCINSRRIPTRDEYWNEHIHSSGGLFFRMSGRMGALLATGDNACIEELSQIGYCFGQVLQAGDDIKDLKQDMAQGYYSLSVINYYETLDSPGKELFAERLKRGLQAEDVEDIYDKMVETGSIEAKLEEIRRRGDHIKMRAENFGDSEARTNLLELAGFLSSRMRLVA